MQYLYAIVPESEEELPELPMVSSKTTNSDSHLGCAALLCLRLDIFHIVIGQAEMMADLVDQNMGDDIAQRFFMFGPIVKDRTAVERDAVGAFAGLQAETLTDATTFEKAEQIKRRFQPHILDDLIVRKVGDLDDDVAAQRTKLLRQMRKSFNRDGFDFVQRGRETSRPVTALIFSGHSSQSCPIHLCRPPNLRPSILAEYI